MSGFCALFHLVCLTADPGHDGDLLRCLDLLLDLPLLRPFEIFCPLSVMVLGEANTEVEGEDGLRCEGKGLSEKVVGEDKAELG